MRSPLIHRVARHVDHVECVIPHVQRHTLLERDHRRVGTIACEELRFVRTERCHTRNVFLHVRREDALAYTFVRDHRHVEERVAGPMITVRFGIDDVAQIAARRAISVLSFSASLGLCGLSIMTMPSFVVTKP
jgi:hypothetical protein